MNKICTSLEQSKKLIELGVDINTADMRYGYIAPYDFSDRMYDGGYDEVPYPKDFLKKNPNFSENEYDGELPAWSLSALLELIPERIPGTKLVIKWDGSYYIEGRDCLFDTAIDAAFEMVVWLKENGKI